MEEDRGNVSDEGVKLGLEAAEVGSCSELVLWKVNVNSGLGGIRASGVCSEEGAGK